MLRGFIGLALESESSAGFFGIGGAGLRAISDTVEGDKGPVSFFDARTLPLAVSVDRAISFREALAGPLDGEVIPVPRGVDGMGGLLLLLEECLAPCDRPTRTQSGSLVGEKGFEGRAGLRAMLFWGGRICERAGRPRMTISSHQHTQNTLQPLTYRCRATISGDQNLLVEVLLLSSCNQQDPHHSFHLCHPCHLYLPCLVSSSHTMRDSSPLFDVHR